MAVKKQSKYKLFKKKSLDAALRMTNEHKFCDAIFVEIQKCTGNAILQANIDDLK
jgi:hypothetical protein